MTTFSQLVDKMMAETKRPDLQTEIATYVNQTIRELHTDPSGKAVFYDSNLQEAWVQANVEHGFAWEIPNVGTFQQLKAARYDSVCLESGYNDDNYPDWPNPHHHHHNHPYAKILKPGRGMNHHPHFCYRTQNLYIFSGYGGCNAGISLAWYEFPGILTYYPLGAFPNDQPPQTSNMRPAQYDAILGWTYDEPWANTPANQTLAQTLTTNWLLLRWPMVIEEGVRAKVYKRLSDDSRSKTAYSMYQQQRLGLYTSEVGDVEGGW
jgi:hypothetical protein